MTDNQQKKARFDVLYYNYQALRRDEETGQLRNNFVSSSYIKNFLYGTALVHYREVSNERLDTILKNLSGRFLMEYRKQNCD
jgi:hypothetical protein